MELAYWQIIILVLAAGCWAEWRYFAGLHKGINRGYTYGTMDVLREFVYKRYIKLTIESSNVGFATWPDESLHADQLEACNATDQIIELLKKQKEEPRS